jgi:hypothetical protein
MRRVMRCCLVLSLLMSLLILGACDELIPSIPGVDVCNTGCLCGSPSESDCAAEECERVYTRRPDGSLEYDYCTNGPNRSLVVDGGSQ